jgi:hypothetical protein
MRFLSDNAMPSWLGCHSADYRRRPIEASWLFAAKPGHRPGRCVAK